VGSAERIDGHERNARVTNSTRSVVAGQDDAPSWRHNREIIRNVGSLLATTGLSSLLGFAYWAVAARLFTQEAVGYAGALVSAMNLLATVGMFGLGTLLIAELPKLPSRSNIITAALLAASSVSAIVGVAFVLLAPHFSVTFRNSLGTPTGALVVAAGVVITAATLVFDQAAIGLLRGGLQLSRNSVFVVAKLLALPAAAVVLHDQFGIGIMLSWVAGAAVSSVPVAIWLWWRGSHVLAQPDWHVLRRMRRKIAAHNWLNLAAQAPTMLIPIVVTIAVSPVANGAFYAAWMLVSFLYILQTHLSTVLFAVASNDPHALARKLRFTLRMSFLFGLPGMAALGLGGHLLLRIFGPGYAAEGAVPLSLLVLAYIPLIPRSYYIAVCRASGRISRAAGVLTGAAIMDVAAVTVGARWHGLVGLSLALLAARVLTGAVTTPSVVRAALGRGRHRRDEVVPGQQLVLEPATFPFMIPDQYATQLSQLAGLALLQRLSRPEDSGSHSPASAALPGQGAST
jgi:O-antigen/teichoic acid export membrane protein